MTDYDAPDCRDQDAVDRPRAHCDAADPMHPAPRSSRRRFLGLAAGGVVATAAGAHLNGADSTPSPADGSGGGPDASSPPTTRPLVAAEDVEGRALVVIELQGGNDGLATVVPREAGVLYDRRPQLHIPDEELLDFTADYGWHPRLAGLAGHGIAALVGLGATDAPDGSHFEMERRWWAGRSNGNDLPSTGFLGRLCDQLVVDQPVTGVSLGTGPSPALASAKAVTVGLGDPESGWFLRSNEPWFANLRAGIDAMSGPRLATPTPEAAARAGLSDTLAFARTLGEIDDGHINDTYPSTDLARSLGLAAELISQESGLRVFHVVLGGFDTHADQLGEHGYLMEQLGDAMGTFLADIADRGYGDSTLVCTTSEFGRRVPQNAGGTDHGAAGVALLAGPVVAGVHGEPPSLTHLDDDNLVATADFEQYYATIAEGWFGIPSSEVLDSGVAPLDGLLTT